MDNYKSLYGEMVRHMINNLECRTSETIMLKNYFKELAFNNNIDIVEKLILDNKINKFENFVDNAINIIIKEIQFGEEIRKNVKSDDLEKEISKYLKYPIDMLVSMPNYNRHLNGLKEYIKEMKIDIMDKLNKINKVDDDNIAMKIVKSMGSNTEDIRATDQIREIFKCIEDFLVLDKIYNLRPDILYDDIDKESKYSNLSYKRIYYVKYNIRINELRWTVKNYNEQDDVYKIYSDFKKVMANGYKMTVLDEETYNLKLADVASERGFNNFKIRYYNLENGRYIYEITFSVFE